MAGEDFDIDSLAAYLHLDPVKVRRMAERGKIPGRRSGREWKFSGAEIHHWLEERIVDSDVAEQTRIESVLDEETGPVNLVELTLDALLVPEAVAVPLAARTRDSVIRSMVEMATDTGWLWDPERLVEAVKQREELYPTAIEGGVALMHPRRPLDSVLGRPFIACGRTDRGLPFGHPRGDLTDIFFLILSVDDAGHLRTLARLGRVLNTPGVLDELREAPDAESLRDVLVSAEKSLEG